MISSTALGQTTGAVNPSPTSAEPLANEGVPLGGCMPIGLTASGEMVFPILCKEFIEQHREKDTEQKPAVPVEKVTAKPAETTAPSEDVMPENSKPIDKPDKTILSQKIPKHELRERAMNQDGCRHYRTYDAASATYRSYDGRRRSCR
jgi:outer membrane biosynthesis protein TonB